MSRNKDKWVKIFGWLFFLFSVAFFFVQVGFLFLHSSLQVEYIDNRLFYIINILCLICLFQAIILLLKTTKKFKLIGISLVVLFVIIHVNLLVDSNKEMKNITSISPNIKHVFSIKENVATGEAVYYRSYYGILGRAKEELPQAIVGEYKVEWLADDIAAFTYQSGENSLQEYIGTYGDRKNGMSYYYVGAEIQGDWQGDNVKLVSSQEGIYVTENNQTTFFEWDNIQQYGTLALVLKRSNVPVWTVSLKENFQVHSDASKPMEGNISLYKVTMEKNQPIILTYQSKNR